MVNCHSPQVQSADAWCSPYAPMQHVGNKRRGTEATMPRDMLAMKATSWSRLRCSTG